MWNICFISEVTSLIENIKSQTDETKPLRPPRLTNMEPTFAPFQRAENIGVSLANGAAVNAGAISV